MPEIHCYWLEPTNTARLVARVYNAERCERSGSGYHEARTFHDVVPYGRVKLHGRVSERDESWGYLGVQHPEEPDNREDERYPRTCECGFIFKRTDHHQWFPEALYRRADGGIVPLTAAKAGAMFDGWWYADGATREQVFSPLNPGSSATKFARSWVNADGICLVVRVPQSGSDLDGRTFDWIVDGQSAKAGPGWTRTGDPRLPQTLSATPSILVTSPGGGYHAILTWGVLKQV